MNSKYIYKGSNMNDNMYRIIGDEPTKGILSCGYMHKPIDAKSQYNFVITYYSCFLLLKGSGYYIDANGHKTRIYAGCMVQRLPGVVHSTQVIGDGEWLEFYISFGKGTFEYLEQLGLISAQRPVLFPNIDDYILSECNSLLDKMKQAKDNELAGILLNAQKIVLLLYKMDRHNESSHSKSLIETACQMLGEKFDQEITPEKVAAKLSIGYESFRKLFKSQVGLAPAAFRISRKMLLAQAMLIDGNSIKQIALILGYADAFAFSKQFKKSLGISPRRYIKSKTRH